MDQNHLLKKCLKGIEQRLSWIDSNLWQQKHFESLSELIYEKTKTRLSPLTLKRLWGKIKYESKPSTTTLDTIAQFLDYKDWIDYQGNQKKKVPNLKFDYFKNKKAVVYATLILNSNSFGWGFNEIYITTKNKRLFKFRVFYPKNVSKYSKHRIF